MVEARGNGSASKEANLMSKAEEFRISAAERDNLANQAKDPEAKRMLHETADDWRKMADQAQRYGWQVANTAATCGFLYQPPNGLSRHQINDPAKRAEQKGESGGSLNEETGKSACWFPHIPNEINDAADNPKQSEKCADSRAPIDRKEPHGRQSNRHPFKCIDMGSAGSLQQWIPSH